SQRMNGVIENVLQLSRRTPPNARRLQLAAWVISFIDDYLQGSRQEQRGTIHVQELRPADITFDAGQLGQVLTNLLDNALRYSEKQTGEASADLVIGIARNRLPY